MFTGKVVSACLCQFMSFSLHETLIC